MRLQRFLILAALVLPLVVAPQVGASTFTAENESSDTMKVYVYNGNDSVCLIDAESAKVHSGDSKEFSCGGGKHRCKVVVIDETTKSPACLDSPEHLAQCGSWVVIKVDTKSVLEIGTDPSVCTVESQDTESSEGDGR